MGKQKTKAADVHLSEVEAPHAIAKTPWARAWLVVGRHRLCVPAPLIGRVTELAKASRRKLADVLADVIQDGLRARGEWPRAGDITLIEGALSARRAERIEQAKAEKEREANDKQRARRLHSNTYTRAAKHYAANPGVLSAIAFRELVRLAELAGVAYAQIFTDLGWDARKHTAVAFMRVFVERAGDTPAGKAFRAMLVNTYTQAIKHSAAEPGVLSAPAFRELVGQAEAAGVEYTQIVADLGWDPHTPRVAAFLRRFVEGAGDTLAGKAFRAMLDAAAVQV